MWSSEAREKQIKVEKKVDYWHEPHSTAATGLTEQIVQNEGCKWHLGITSSGGCIVYIAPEV